MRGSPILRAVLAFLAILAFAPLLSKVTAPSPAIAGPKAEAAVAAKIQLSLAFTALPTRITIIAARASAQQERIYVRRSGRARAKKRHNARILQGHVSALCMSQTGYHF